MKPMRLRVLVLPIAALVIWAAVEYRLSLPDENSSDSASVPATSLKPPPPLEGTDSENHFFRLNRYVGRHEVFVVFFDPQAGHENDPLLAKLKPLTPTLKSRGIRVVAVSAALPQQNRDADFSSPNPFVFVTDPDQVWKAHKAWGCLETATGTPLQKVFHISRDGRIAMRNGSPEPVEIDELIRSSLQ